MLTKGCLSNTFNAAHDRRDAGIAPQSTGGTPGDGLEQLEPIHARGAPVCDFHEIKDISNRMVAAAVEIKLASDKLDAGLVTGYGSVFGVRDLHGDIIERGAFAKSLATMNREKRAPAMLWSHDPERPVGVWTSFTEDAYGLKLAGRLNLEIEDGRAARSLLKQGAFNGLSVGFRVRPNGARMQKDGIRYLTDLELWEVSFVTLPSNLSARIDGVKSIATKRDFENLLRESGFSKAAATKLAASGWNALSEDSGASELVEVVRRATLDLKELRR